MPLIKRNTINNKYKFCFYDSVDSTNIIAKNLIKSSVDINNFIIVANEQVLGKGRLDRSWESKKGNIFLSLITDKASLHLYMHFIISLALSSFLQAKGYAAKCKWPNDIMLDDKKLSGILMEKINQYIVIGVGINISNASIANSTCLDIELTDDFLLNFLDEFIKYFEYFVLEYKNNGFQSIKLQWLENSVHHIGQEITVKIAEIEHKGVFDGIGEAGELLLKTQYEIKKIFVGDVIYCRYDK
ncbi:MAG: biotin--[acetyl-CoA-carboxylase] ligase [Anaplasmataceae bacterium]|nr:biotin--[acetyl-CoA-carboxylase] ligase [Anaplasmataceae bacterium]